MSQPPAEIAPFECPACENRMTVFLDGYLCNTATDVCGFKVHMLDLKHRYEQHGMDEHGNKIQV